MLRTMGLLERLENYELRSPSYEFFLKASLRSAGHAIPLDVVPGF